MSRIPSLNNFEDTNLYSNAIDKFVCDNSEKYEAAFSGFLMDYVKEDIVLKNFYIRFIYECEIIKIVIDKRNDMQLEELEMIIENMESAPTLEVLAVYDSLFHQKLFSIAEREDFFKWFRLQSKDLAHFLSGFWNAIGYQTDYYWELLKIHREIYNAVNQKDTDKALEMMERHFAILLFQLLGTMFSQKRE